MRARHLSCLIPFGMAGLLLAGCGKSDSGHKQAAAAQATAKAIDPCKLLTKADARKVLGAAVTDGRINHDVGFAPGTRCSYFTSAPIEVAGGTWSVSVEVYDMATFKARGSYFKSPDVYFHRNRKALKSVKQGFAKDISGVGEAAYWTGDSLNVLDRGVYLVVSVHANFHIPPGPGEKVRAAEDAAELHAAEDLAKSVLLPRLEKMG